MAEECRSCHAEIDWATGPDGVKTNPINRGSADDPKGNLAVRRDEHGLLRYRYLRKGQEPEPGEHRAISHYATCPHAAEWRERRKSKPAWDSKRDIP